MTLQSYACAKLSTEQQLPERLVLVKHHAPEPAWILQFAKCVSVSSLVVSLHSWQESQRRNLPVTGHARPLWPAAMEITFGPATRSLHVFSISRVCLAAGSSTCFQHVFSTTLGGAQSEDRSSWPEQFQQACLCENYQICSDACSRTWLRGHAQDNLMCAPPPPPPPPPPPSHTHYWWHPLLCWGLSY